MPIFCPACMHTLDYACSILWLKSPFMRNSEKTSIWPRLCLICKENAKFLFYMHACMHAHNNACTIHVSQGNTPNWWKSTGNVSFMQSFASKRIKLKHGRERPHQNGDRIRKLCHCLIGRVTWVWVARTREIGSFWLETLPKMGQMMWNFGPLNHFQSWTGHMKKKKISLKFLYMQNGISYVQGDAMQVHVLGDPSQMIFGTSVFLSI